MMNPSHDRTPIPHRALCPVCKTAVYSLAGIHPQCALSQADLPKPEGNPRGGPDSFEWMGVEAAEVGTGDDPRPSTIPVAEIIGVPLWMIRLWIDTGAWPLPHSVRGGTLLFDLSEVECWLRTGAWPTGVHFRKRPRRPAGRRASLHDVHGLDLFLVLSQSGACALQGRRPEEGLGG
jgi:hypothetical protein